MKEFWNMVQMVFAAVGGWLGYFLGGNDGLLIALVLFVAVDYLTGWLHSLQRCPWGQSHKRRWQAGDDRTVPPPHPPAYTGQYPETG